MKLSNELPFATAHAEQADRVAGFQRPLLLFCCPLYLPLCGSYHAVPDSGTKHILYALAISQSVATHPYKNPFISNVQSDP